MKSVSKAWREFALAAALCVGSGTAFAWDGLIQGVPTQIDVTDGSNFGLRVYVAAPTGGSGWCSPDYSWAYLNSTDSNYNTYVAAVLMAKATGASLMIFQTKDANGRCHIGYLSVS